MQAVNRLTRHLPESGQTKGYRTRGVMDQGVQISQSVRSDHTDGERMMCDAEDR